MYTPNKFNSIYTQFLYRSHPILQTKEGKKANLSLLELKSGVSIKKVDAECVGEDRERIENKIYC
jgi:hypothetical protein